MPLPHDSGLHLSHAARVLVDTLDHPDLTEAPKVAARMVWSALTGLGENEAIAYARLLAAQPHADDLTAYVPSF